MPIYCFWGEDDYRLQQAVQQLREQVLDPAWLAFNYDHLGSEELIVGLNQALTPVFGAGCRMVWLEDTKLLQQCPPDFYAELERTLKQIPDTTHLIFTSKSKPDGRLGSTKLLKQLATMQEFSVIPPWDQDALVEQVRNMAETKGLQLTDSAVSLLATAVGSDSRQLAMELEKLHLFADTGTSCLDENHVRQVVTLSNVNSLQLAGALRQGQIAQALTTLQHLLDHNEPGLKIVAVMVGQFRTWLWVKLLTEQKVRDPQSIAQQAEISNPKRIYFLQKEVQGLPSQSLLQSLQWLLALEWDLKRGRPERETWQNTCVQICQLLATSRMTREIP